MKSDNVLRSLNIILTAFCLYSQLLFSQNAALQFPEMCTNGKKIIVASVGDLLFHHPLQLKARDQGFESLWQEALPFFASADIVYGNLEGPIGAGILPNGQQIEDPQLWRTYLLCRFPSFNYHPSVASALKKSGFHVVSNANNHILDRGSLGIDKTIQALDQAKILHTGAKAKESNVPWHTIVEVKGVKVGWIACTEHTNGIPDKQHQVLSCYQSSDRNNIVSTIRELTKQVDVVIISPHWGSEYQTIPNRAQKEFAKEVLNAGASAVIGSHPHVLQPVEKYVTNDGRATLISYSLGNFVSYQGSPKNRISMILLLGFTKSANSTIINSVRFVPIKMENRSGIDNIHVHVLSKEQFYNSYKSLYAPIIPIDNVQFSLPLDIPACEHQH